MPSKVWSQRKADKQQAHNRQHVSEILCNRFSNTNSTFPFLFGNHTFVRPAEISVSQ